MDTKKEEEEERGWNEVNEQNVKNLGELCMAYKWMYTKSSKYYSNLHLRLVIASMVLNALVSSLLLIHNQFSLDYLETLNILISFIELIFLIILQQAQYDELSGDYVTFASKYSSLVSNIRKQLSIKREEREYSKDYITWINTSYEELFDIAPPLKEWVIKKYKLIAKEHNLPVPESVSTILTINVTDKQNTNTKEEKELPTPDPLHIEEGPKRIKTSRCEMETYNDNNMRYEMNRLMNHGGGGISRYN